MSGGLTLDPSALSGSGPTQIERLAKHCDIGAVPVCAGVVGEAILLACGDGRLRMFAPDGSMTAHDVHRGAILSMAVLPDEAAVLTGGDDGRFLRVAGDGTVTELAHYPRRWVDHVAAGRGGRIACSVGRIVHLSDGTGKAQALDHPSTVGGLAFDAKGGRLAVAHYGGVTVWTKEKRGWKSTALHWAGSHTGVTFSPDSRFVISTMQENALHGWRLRDKADLRMSGYPSRVKGWDWAGALPWLVTTGADQAVLWPFDGAKGPMGRAPLQLCWSVPSLVTAVAAAPAREIVFAGFATGQVVFSEIDAMAEPRMVKRSAGAPVTVLTCTAGGRLLLAEDEGRVMWADLSAI
jgi:WD40 repeat protein